MTDKARLPGIFHGINFVTKSKGEDQGVTQKVLLAFGADMDAVAQEHILNLIRWSKQPVLLEVSKQQLSLEDGKGTSQGDLPGIRPPAASPALPTVTEGFLEGAKTMGAALHAQLDPSATWFEREVRGPDQIMHSIFVRADGKMFACWDCGDVFEAKAGDDLEAMVREHACAEDERVCRICGCTERHACPGGCAWVEPDLCSNPECLVKAGYSTEEIDKIRDGELPLVWGNRTADVLVCCADGVSREFEVQITDNRIESLSCDGCGEIVVHQRYGRNTVMSPSADDLYGLARNHRCPDLCPKCRAKERHGDALADLLILHRAGCKAAPYNEPMLDGLIYQLTQKSYAQRIREAFALDPVSYIGYGREHVTALVLEDAAEALARIEELAGIQPAKLRPETYLERGRLSDYNAKSALAELKKAVKEKKDRTLAKQMNTILDGVKEAQKALKDAQKEVQEKEREALRAKLQADDDAEDPDEDPDEEPGEAPEGEPEGAEAGEGEDGEIFEAATRPSASDSFHTAKVVIQSTKTYVDDLGRPLVVADDGELFGVYRQRKEGSLVQVKRIPACYTLGAAEKALEAFARKCGFLRADGTREAPLTAGGDPEAAQ